MDHETGGLVHTRENIITFVHLMGFQVSVRANFFVFNGYKLFENVANIKKSVKIKVLLNCSTQFCEKGRRRKIDFEITVPCVHGISIKSIDLFHRPIMTLFVRAAVKATFMSSEQQ
jgi:hypothetical protein